MAEGRTQRKLAAIMAADVVGYSRLMGEDETGTLNALNLHRAELIHPTVAEHRGRIVKLMGDGALVEFPSVVDAVECAVSVQRGMNERNVDIPESKRITFRIGINLGDIIIEGDDIYGEGVNVAARLEGIAEPGGICISGTVFEHVKGKLDLSFDDLGQQEVKNIAEPVRVYRIPVGPNADKELEPRTTDTPPTQSDKPSVAVLPFDNLSDDPQQEYFSDGLAEDLITDLSKISNLSVAARNSSFTYKGRAVKVQDVSREMGVTHVLEGSVRKMGDRLRINAQLIDGTEGRHVWAERYDGNMAEIFEFQDAIREQIVSALRVSLTPTDKALTQRKPTDSVEAYDLFLRGRAEYYRYTLNDMAEAEKHLTQAIDIDPNLADAYAYLARCIFGSWVQRWPGHDKNLDRAIEMAERAVALEGDSALSYTMLAWIQNFVRQFEHAEENFERAISLNPNNPEVHATYALARAFWGEPEKTLAALERALEIDPVGHPNADFLIAQCHYLSGRYEEAANIFPQVIERRPGFMPARVHLAATLVAMDQVTNAREIIVQTLELGPQLTLDDMEEIFPYRINEERIRFLDALRQAGLPQ